MAKRDFTLEKIIGKKVVAIMSFERNQGGNSEAKYILFDDGKTYIELKEQDYFSFHDCSSFARIIHVYEDRDVWQRIVEGYEDANCDPY